MRGIKRGVIALSVALALASGAAGAREGVMEQRLAAQPSGGAMIADALIGRPLLAAATLGGTALFLVSLPFSALGGNVEAAAETLIKTPAEATFRRCLGCSVSRRADEL